ncbi:MAG: NAD(P)/FAD-dependent oxidoreductase [Alphaproteobacteria bacterium]|nr:NAD(P)/FAD-dependent oxidoreductase [Alphaproteobacteria bacterium]
MSAAAKTPDRAPVSSKVDAVVVGAGFAGLYMVHRLRQAGLSVQGFEAGGDVGGTWYWNRYPGARCDIPSLLYSYTFSDELHDEWKWSEKYAPQPEILNYANHVADRFGLRSAFLFDTRVGDVTFNEATKRWTVKTDKGDTVEAQFCIMGTGCLSVPKEPDIKGHEDFKGLKIVTGRWPHEKIDFKGKKVALIGTGSSAIQSMPIIAAEAAEVYVFQRTPNFSLPALNAPLADAEVAAFNEGYAAYKEALRQGLPGIPLPPEDWEPNAEELKALTESLWNGMGLLSLSSIPKITRDRRINDAAADYVRAKVKELVKDPVLAQKLTPGNFPIATKRACVDTDYYVSFNRDNVKLVDLNDTPIERITAAGVKTSDAQYDVDILIFATGFDAMTGALMKMNITGRGGKSLRAEWAHGPRTYLGLQVAGFPNLFTVTGPGSPSVLSNMITSVEQHVDWIMDAIVNLRAKGKATMEATPTAQDAWVQHVNAEADQTLYGEANSWYLGANVPGKPRVFMPYVGQNYKIRIDEVAAKGYEGFQLAG